MAYIIEYTRLTNDEVIRLGLDASDPDIEWITVNGNHIPLKKGLNKSERGQAIREFFEKKGEKAPIKRQSKISYAGSGVKYSKPSLSAVGSGEGNAAHGYGLYYAENEKTAKKYANKAKGIKYDGEPLSKWLADVFAPKKRGTSFWRVFKGAAQNKMMAAFNKSPEDGIKSLIWHAEGLRDMYASYTWGDEAAADVNRVIEKIKAADPSKFSVAPGFVIKVRLPGNKWLLHEGTRVKDQPAHVQKALNELQEYLGDEAPWNENTRGGKLYEDLMFSAGRITGDWDVKARGKWASEKLAQYGIKGIKYYGQTDGRGFVIFDPEDIEIINDDSKPAKDAADDDITWITVKGNHIPIKAGQTKEEAVKEFLARKKKRDTATAKKEKAEAKVTEITAKRDAVKQDFENLFAELQKTDLTNPDVSIKSNQLAQLYGQLERALEKEKKYVKKYQDVLNQLDNEENPITDSGVAKVVNFGKMPRERAQEAIVQIKALQEKYPKS